MLSYVCVCPFCGIGLLLDVLSSLSCGVRVVPETASVACIQATRHVHLVAQRWSWLHVLQDQASSRS
jgi:hypothetical protein